jgi:hypothetical protein
MADDDRKAKLLQKLLVEAKDQGKPTEEVISYVYDKKAATVGSSPFSDRKGKESVGKNSTLKAVGAKVL